MRSNKVECSTATGLYCTTHDVKVTLCMPEFSSSNIIEHHFHINNNKVESVIGYDRIIGHDPMVQLGVMAEYKCHVLQWDGATVPMEETSSLLGKSD